MHLQPLSTGQPLYSGERTGGGVCNYCGGRCLLYLQL